MLEGLEGILLGAVGVDRWLLTSATEVLEVGNAKVKVENVVDGTVSDSAAGMNTDLFIC